MTITDMDCPEIAALRFNPKEVRLTLLQSVLHWLHDLRYFEWNWERTVVEMQAIKPGEPGYDDAPYVLDVEWDSEATTSGFAIALDGVSKAKIE